MEGLNNGEKLNKRDSKKRIRKIERDIARKASLSRIITERLIRIGLPGTAR